MLVPAGCGACVGGGARQPPALQRWADRGGAWVVPAEGGACVSGGARQPPAPRRAGSRRGERIAEGRKGYLKKLPQSV